MERKHHHQKRSRSILQSSLHFIITSYYYYNHKFDLSFLKKQQQPFITTTKTKLKSIMSGTLSEMKILLFE
jgi:hypothetical protein